MNSSELNRTGKSLLTLMHRVKSEIEKDNEDFYHWIRVYCHLDAAYERLQTMRKKK